MFAPSVPFSRVATRTLLLLGVVVSLLVTPMTAQAHFCPDAGRNLASVFGRDGTFPKVEVCHRTGSDTNPYVLIEVNYHAVCRAHHPDHHEDVPDGGEVTAEDILPEDFDEPAEFASVCDFGSGRGGGR